MVSVFVEKVLRLRKLRPIAKIDTVLTRLLEVRLVLLAMVVFVLHLLLLHLHCELLDDNGGILFLQMKTAVNV